MISDSLRFQLLRGVLFRSLHNLIRGHVGDGRTDPDAEEESSRHRLDIDFAGARHVLSYERVIMLEMLDSR